MQVPSWELCFAVTLVKKFPGLGFGLAGIFMFFGMLQFYFTQDIFGSIGLKPSAESKQASKAKAAAENTPPNVIRPYYCRLIFSVFTVFFWAAFEQAGGSMTILQKNIHKDCLE
jgi:POT family proton-dependent oligopeptide transporter